KHKFPPGDDGALEYLCQEGNTEKIVETWLAGALKSGKFVFITFRCAPLTFVLATKWLTRHDSGEDLETLATMWLGDMVPAGNGRCSDLRAEYYEDAVIDAMRILDNYPSPMAMLIGCLDVFMGLLNTYPHRQTHRFPTLIFSFDDAHWLPAHVLIAIRQVMDKITNFP